MRWRHCPSRFQFNLLVVSISVGTGAGVNAALSRLLGEKDQKGVDDAASNSVFIALLTSMSRSRVENYAPVFYQLYCIIMRKKRVKHVGKYSLHHSGINTNGYDGAALSRLDFIS